MAISVKEAAVYFALAESVRLRTKVAIRFEANGKVIAIGIDDARTVYDARSAIINVLQNSRTKNENFIATSFPANTDEKSLGMCIIENVKEVFYLDSGTRRVQVVTLQSGQNPPRAVAPFQPGNGDVFVNFDAPQNIAHIEGWFDQIGPNLPQKLNIHNKGPADYAKQVYDTFIAKRDSLFGHINNFPNLTLPDNLPSPGARVNNPLRHEIFNKLAWAIVGEAAVMRGTGPGQYPNGHNIGCVMRGSQDEIIGWGINTGTGSRNTTLHGEVNLLLNYRKPPNMGGEIGVGDNKPIIYSTLEPCHMCAGIIATAGDGLRCYYSQSDEAIQHNALERSINNSAQIAINDIANIARGANRMGRVAGSAYGYEERREGGRTSVTTILNKDIRQGILHAIQDYFDLVPQSGSPQRVIWDASTEKIIWEAGLKLLYHINPGVQAKWEAYTPSYVPGILP